LPITAKKQLAHAAIKREKTNKPTLATEEETTITNELQAGFEAAIQNNNSGNDVTEKSIEMGGRNIKVPTVRIKGVLPPGTKASNKFYNPKSKAAGGNGLDGILVTLNDALAAENRAGLIKRITAAIKPLPMMFTDKEDEKKHYKDAIVKLAQAGTEINVKHYLLVRFILEGGAKEGVDENVDALTDQFGDDVFNIGED